MSFSLHDFIMAGLRDAVGSLPDYKVIMNATGWYEKDVLTESDLAEIQSLIETSHYLKQGLVPPSEPEEAEELGAE